MRAALFWLPSISLLAGLLTQAGQAEACGASPPPFYVVDAQAPTGTQVPLNTPLWVGLREEPSGSFGAYLDPQLTLTQEGSDAVVAVKRLGTEPLLSWVPVAPLQPGTTYEAHYNPGYEGVPDTIWTFTTGGESVAPLSLTGTLEVTLEPGMQTIWQCPPNSCPCGCSNADLAAACTPVQAPVTNARVRFPRTVGGFPQRTGTVWLTDDKPFDLTPPSKAAPEPYRGTLVSSSHFVNLDDAELFDVLIPLPEEPTAYTPCFAFTATDGRGDTVSAQSLCLDEQIQQSSGEGGAGPVDGLATDQAKRPNTSSGCSLGGASSTPSGWLALFGLLSVLQRRRRRHA